VVQVTANLDAAPSIRILSRLYDPEVVPILGELLQHLVVARIVVSFHEFQELSVVLALLYVVGQRDRVKGVLADRLVVYLHVVVDGFFVAKVEVVFLVVRRYHVVRSWILFLLLLLVVALSLASDVLANADLLESFAAARRYARVCFL